MSHKKMIFVYDFTGEPMGSGTINDLIDRFKLLGGSSRLWVAIKRGDLVGGKYYFTESDEFIMPIKKIRTNPILQISKFSMDEFGFNTKKIYTEDEKMEIIYKWSSDDELAEKHGVRKKTIQTMRSKWLKQAQ